MPRGGAPPRGFGRREKRAAIILALIAFTEY
jgi:hypothetical protein